MSRARTLVATELILVFGLLGFVACAYLIERVGNLDSAVALPPSVALFLSAIPAVLWLAYFHAQDRHEPEPKHYVLGVFLLGAFVAGPVAGFVIDHARPGEVLGLAPATTFSPRRIIEAIFVVGMAQELAKYVVVRYTVYKSTEFDEPMDGLIYMTASGIGFASYENFHYLQGIGGKIFLATGAANTVVTTLAHACFAAAVGYVMGRAKFSNIRNPLHAIVLFVGLLVAAGLSGAFQLVETEVLTSGLTVQPWRAIAVAASFAAVVFAVVTVLMRRLLAASPHIEKAEG